MTFTTMNVNGEVRNGAQPLTLTIPAGQECCIYVNAGLFANSANGYATLYFHYTYLGAADQRLGAHHRQQRDPALPHGGQSKGDPNPPNDSQHMLKSCGATAD